MSFFSIATALFWVLPILFQFLVAIILFRRGLVSQFPFFFAFIALVPARDAILFLLRRSRDIYATVFWWGEAVAIILALAVIFEISLHFVRPYPFLKLFLKVLYITAGILAAGAFAMLVLTKGPAGTDLALEWIILTERSARFLQVCLLVVAIAFMSRLGLAWQNYSLGIAAGFGVYAAFDLILLELRTHSHVLTDTTFVLMRSASYNLGVLIWVFYFLRNRGADPIDRLPGNDLAGWSDALRPHLNKWYRR
jgi:hypothetical protein